MPNQIATRFRAAGRLGAGLLLVVLAGCGPRDIYPVHGQLVDPQGSPITGMQGGSVEFECPEAHMSSNGGIGPDGTFRLTTKRPGDGAHVGKNRVAITRPDFGLDKPAPHVIDPKYERFETSGLEVTVEPKDNDVRLTVERVRGRK